MNITISVNPDLNFWIAFSAGILSFFSPCILPLIPSYLSIITGLSIDDLKTLNKKVILLRVIWKTLFFSLGFSLIFILLGATATSIGKLLHQYQNLIFKIGGVIVIIFGVAITGIIKLNFLNYEKRLNIKTSKNFFFPFLFGLTFSLGWSPCIGPILASILIYASSAETVLRGVVFLSIYSLALSIMFLISGILFTFLLTKIPKISKYTGLIEKISGILLIILGILMIFGKFQF